MCACTCNLYVYVHTFVCVYIYIYLYVCNIRIESGRNTQLVCRAKANTLYYNTSALRGVAFIQAPRSRIFDCRALTCQRPRIRSGEVVSKVTTVILANLLHEFLEVLISPKKLCTYHKPMYSPDGASQDAPKPPRLH